MLIEFYCRISLAVGDLFFGDIYVGSLANKTVLVGVYWALSLVTDVVSLRIDRDRSFLEFSYCIVSQLKVRSIVCPYIFANYSFSLTN